MTSRRVVISGLGLVTPLGVGTEETWEALLSGSSGVTLVDLMGDPDQPRYPAAPVPDYRIADYVPDRKLLRVMCPTDRFGLTAARMAADEAPAGEVLPERRGAFVATGKEMGPPEVAFDATRAGRDEAGRINAVSLGRDGFPLIPPLTLVSGLANGCLFAVSVLHTIHGFNTNFLGSGEVGLSAIGAAYHAVREGAAEWALAGGHDSGVDRWSYADFHRLGMLCPVDADPAGAVRPLDRRRAGFAVGEGAAMVVVEPQQRVRARGGREYAEITGFASTCDAHGLISPAADGTALAAAIEGALQQAGLAPTEVDYVNAYASATRIGDHTELLALESVFGGGPRRPLVSGIKGATGHLLAASGAVELGLTALAVQRQVAPPTRNLEEPDAHCRFDCIPGAARRAPLAHAITISRGIGGQNCVMVLRRAEE